MFINFVLVTGAACDRVNAARPLEKTKVGADESAMGVAQGVSAFVLSSPKGPVIVVTIDFARKILQKEEESCGPPHGVMRTGTQNRTTKEVPATEIDMLGDRFGELVERFDGCAGVDPEHKFHVVQVLTWFPHWHDGGWSRRYAVLTPRPEDFSKDWHCGTARVADRCRVHSSLALVEMVTNFSSPNYMSRPRLKS